MDNTIESLKTAINNLKNEPKDEVNEETSQVQHEEVHEDRSAYNCTDCKGEGLISQNGIICATCHGTGKV